MSIELDNPFVEEIIKKEIAIDATKMRRLWKVSSCANSQIGTAGKNQFPRIDRISDKKKTKLNEHIKSALENQSTLVVHHGTFSIVLDSAQSAYYQIDDIDAQRVLSGRVGLLKTPALSGKLNANISFDANSAWINIYLDHNSFSHLLYGPDQPNDIPLIFEITKDQNPPTILFGFNPHAKNVLFLEKSVA
jgi:hypothetical protein